MSPDVITKFTYLEYGKHAPKHSSFKGIITTKSIIGFTNYGKRKESRELSDDAKAIVEQNKNFFNYTKERIGATKTYSSLGWINSPDMDLEFREAIAAAFHQNGNIIWVPVLSLRDFMTSTEMKLFNEEDYAAVFDKILPIWFQRAGFDNDNMIWWMDHHVNTDNPHIHFNFLEKKQTRMNGKLPMKYIKDFKSLFWKEVFSKKRYLENIGKSVEAGFKQKDLLKQETYKSFKDEFKKITDPDFIKKLQSLYNKLPLTGRLQYNASHMIPYRRELDQLVDLLLKTEIVNEHYLKFLNSVKDIDAVRSKALNTKYTSISVTEDKKLRSQLANEILKEYKNINQEFWEQQFIKAKENTLANEKYEPNQNEIFIPIANSLIKGNNDKRFLIRVPGSQNCVYINKDDCIQISTNRNFLVGKVYPQNYEVFNCNGIYQNQTICIDDIKTKFSSGLPYLESISSENNTKTSWQRIQKEWSINDYKWDKSVNSLKRVSFAWMHEIEQEVDRSRNEYLDGKEYDLM